MSTTVSYKGNVIATISNTVKKLLTKGKYLEDDITITDSGGGGGGAVLETLQVSYTPSETAISDTQTPSAGYDGFDEAQISVAAIPSSYVGSGVTRRSSSDMTVSGAVVTAPAGYYENPSSKTVTGMKRYKSGTFTPSTDWNTLTNHEITTIANIGFTPSKLVMAPTDLYNVSGVQYAILGVTYEAIGSPVHYRRSYTRYSNTSGTLGQAGNITNWTTRANGHFYLSGGTVYYRTASNCILKANVEYTWEAYE